MATYVTLKSKTKLGCDICDRCCINRGDIKITPVNVIEISRYMNITPKEFIERYTSKLESQPLELVIKAKESNNRCILNNSENSKCEIHPVKPMQCVTFPLIPVDLKKDVFYKQDTCDCSGQKEMRVLDWLNGRDGIYVKYKKVYIEWIKLVEDIQKVWDRLNPATQNEIFDILYYGYDDNMKDIARCVRRNIKKVRKGQKLL